VIGSGRSKLYKSERLYVTNYLTPSINRGVARTV